MDTILPDEDVPELVSYVDYYEQAHQLDSLRNSHEITDEEYYTKRNKFVNVEGAYVFETDEDIIQLVDKLASAAEDDIIFPVKYVSNPKRMMQLGLWPTSIEMGSLWVADWLSGVSTDIIESWNTTISPEFLISHLHDEMVWKYSTMETIIKEAVQTCNSIKLKLYAPEMLYKQSNRPITDMSLFRSPLSLTCRRENIVRNKLLIHEGKVLTGMSGRLSGVHPEAWNVIPVTRYAQGMSKGLYHGDVETPKDVCGTFYYHEPESTTLLAYRTSLRAFNKTDACLKLGLRLSANTRVGDNFTLKLDLGVKKHIDGVYPLNLMMTQSILNDAMEEENVHPNLDIYEVPHYAADVLDLYAAEDHLDQPLCNAARNAGYDVVILENMVGAFQIVTEVLDTRSREDSFKSLIYVLPY